MISGFVNAILEVVIQFPIEDSAGQQVDIHAAVDTGFTGWLTLPLSMISGLGLVWHSKRILMLADGTTQRFDAYQATVIWDGISRSIEVYAVDTDPLVGMKLLEGHALRADIKVGGMVTIEALP